MVMRRMCLCQTVEFTWSCELVTSEVVAVPCGSEGVDIENTGCYASQGFSLECTLIVKTAQGLVSTLLTHDLLMCHVLCFIFCQESMLVILKKVSTCGTR